MKILILANSDGGLYNFRKELVQTLLNVGHEVIISVPMGDRVDYFIEMGCTYKEIELERHGTNPIKELKLLSKYKKLIKEVRPDIVFTYTIKPNIYGAMACKKYKVPCVANITGLGTAVENKGLSQLITVALYKLAFRKIKKVFFQNKENMSFFQREKIALGKHELLPGSGVNLNHFEPLDYPTSDKIEFLFISRIMKQKGIEQYLEAAKFIKQKYPNTVFNVCGGCEQDYQAKLNQLTEEGTIIYHGRIKDVKGFMKNISCTVHPTYYPEGMSNVLLESCACARPVITTNRAGCREIVDDGVNGYIVRAKDSSDVIEKIEKFLSLTFEQRREMGLAGRKKVEEQFDRQIVIDKYLGEL